MIIGQQLEEIFKSTESIQTIKCNFELKKKVFHLSKSSKMTVSGTISL